MQDVMVHLDGTEGDEIRLVHAERLATLFGSHVTGLFTNLMPGVVLPAEAGVMAAEIISEMVESAQKTGKATAEKLAARLDRLQNPHELRRLDVFPGEVGGRVAAEARWADVFVALRPYAKEGPARWPEIVESVLFESGRCLYVAPPGGAPAKAGYECILVAWNGTREAARAISEAMPLLRKARRVVVAVAGDEGASGPAAQEPGADIARHLVRQKIKVELRNLRATSGDVANAMLNEAQALAADLIVMGGYGHSRFREWAMGGATRDMLHQAQVPLLLAH